MKLIPFPGSDLTPAHIKGQIRGQKSSWRGVKKHKIDNIEENNAVGELKLLQCVV